MPDVLSYQRIEEIDITLQEDGMYVCGQFGNRSSESSLYFRVLRDNSAYIVCVDEVKMPKSSQKPEEKRDIALRETVAQGALPETKPV